MTLFTSLVEGEAIHMARDFAYVCETEFPSRQLAEYVHEHEQPPQYYADVDERRRTIASAKQMMKQLLDILNQDRSPLCNSRPQPLLDPSIQRHLTHFSLVTHGFGTPAIISALQAMNAWLGEMAKLIDEQDNK